MKLSEIKIFNNQTKSFPILLLDDVFSEFDREKINNIMKYILDNMQVIITSTDVKNIQKKILDQSLIYKIENGTIKKDNRGDING